MSDEEEEMFVFSPDPSLLGLAPTPGDWRQHPEQPERIILNGSTAYEIADAVLSRPPNKADVRLMAAAPSLLATVKRMREVFEKLSDGDWRSLDATYVDQLIESDGLHGCDLAISKAEGGK